MTKIREWLTSLDLGRYADAFEDNAIDWDLLADLTDDDLRTMGVAALGHRKRILKATSETSEGTAAPPTAAPPMGVPAPTTAAERRQLTVMFCDLVGSTELSQTLDPEELSEVNRAYQDAAKASIEKYGGYVARYMGDGVLAYFGYPQAHEDDAERAVRAGLALTDTIPSLRTTPRLAVRVGIATGPVVVGDLIGEGASQESAVVGETPNLAARLQGEARADTVTISGATRALVAGLFDCSDLGARRLKGFAAEQRLWRVTGETQSESRFEALRSKKLTAFVGRDGELGVLLNRWESAVAGEGQVVLIEGDPGIGKSRLADELRRAVASTSHTPLRYQCSPHHTNTAFFPFVSQLEHASDILLEDDPDSRLDKLEQILAASTAERSKTLWLLAKLLSLPTQRYPALSLEPQALKSETIAALRGQLAALCAEAPVLVVFEDMHWIDPTSLEVLDLLVQSGQELPVLFILTHRPGFESRWDARGYVTKLQLNRLPRRDGSVIIRQVAGGKSLPDEVVEEILAKTDGVALFVEELTKTVLEGGLLRQAEGSYVLDGPLPDLAIPSTLRDSLMARLDRLVSAKEVAQVGACIGREFSFRLLRSIEGLDENEIRLALEQLVDNELIYRRGSPPESSYVFKHALLQDAAYQSLLMKTRKLYHGRIARALEERFPDTANSAPELVAHHCSRAELFEQAVGYWRRAGSNAFSARANREATRCFEQALVALAHLPETADALEQGVDLRFDLRNALFALGELEQILEYVREAERLAESLGDQQRLARASSYLTQVTWSLGDHERAISIGRRAAATAEAAAHFASQIVVNFTLGQAYHSVGDYPRTIEVARKNVASLTGGLVLEHCGLVGLPSVMSRTWMSWSLAELGQLAEAASVGEEALRIAEEYNHPFTLILALWGVGRLDVLSGRVEKAVARLERALELCRRWSFSLLLPWTAARLGHAYALTDRAAEGVPLLEEAVRSADSMKGAGFHSLSVSLLGEGLLLSGRPEEAIEIARAALTFTRERKERGREAWALHLLGEIASDPSGEQAGTGESYYRESLSLASQLGMRALVAHCHRGLGLLHQRAEHQREAQDYLRTAAALSDEMGMQIPPRG